MKALAWADLWATGSINVSWQDDPAKGSSLTQKTCSLTKFASGLAVLWNKRPIKFATWARWALAACPWLASTFTKGVVRLFGFAKNTSKQLVDIIAEISKVVPYHSVANYACRHSRAPTATQHSASASRSVQFFRPLRSRKETFENLQVQTATFQKPSKLNLEMLNLHGEYTQYGHKASFHERFINKLWKHRSNLGM